MMPKGNQGTKAKNYSFHFLAGVILLYLLVFIIEPEETYDSLVVSAVLFVSIIPTLVFVILLMGAVNFWVKPKTIARHVGEGSGLKGWVFAVLTGILSHGPIYVWYPLLKELREHGMRDGLIATFLYNRAVKIPLLPILVFYFGAAFAIILLAYMILASLLEGKVIDMLGQYRKVKT